MLSIYDAVHLNSLGKAQILIMSGLSGMNMTSLLEQRVSTRYNGALTSEELGIKTVCTYSYMAGLVDL